MAGQENMWDCSDVLEQSFNRQEAATMCSRVWLFSQKKTSAYATMRMRWMHVKMKLLKRVVHKIRTFNVPTSNGISNGSESTTTKTHPESHESTNHIAQSKQILEIYISIILYSFNLFACRMTHARSFVFVWNNVHYAGDFFRLVVFL